MSYDIYALLDLWSGPQPAAEDFRQLYSDPVTINGAVMSVDDLVTNAQGLQRALADVRREVLDVCDAGSKVAVAFRLEGRHVGPLTTAAGVLPPTGERISLRVIDILTLTDGKITNIVMVAGPPE